MSVLMCVVCFFKQKTAYEMRISDWSSDVCSSDLLGFAQASQMHGHHLGIGVAQRAFLDFFMQGIRDVDPYLVGAAFVETASDVGGAADGDGHTQNLYRFG